QYVAVFVSSEDSIPRRMKLKISDLSKEESMEYLNKKCKINEIKVKNLYELVGGRIVELQAVADDFVAGQSFEVLAKIEKKFQSAQLLPNNPHYKVGKSIINDLLKSEKLSFLAFKKHFNKNDELNEVLRSNIFAYHLEKNTVSFQSQSVKYYILEKADIFIK
ncbi:2169_t:CDS:2, partial [Dentiscutata erythropus]